MHQLQSHAFYLFNHHTEYLALPFPVFRKEKDTCAVASLFGYRNALEENKFMRNLYQYSCAVTGLVTRLSATVLHILQYFKSVIHQFMVLVAMNVYNHSNATRIMFVLGVVKSLFLFCAHD